MEYTPRTEINILESHMEEEIFVKSKSFTFFISEEESKIANGMPLQWAHEYLHVKISLGCAVISAVLTAESQVLSRVTREKISIDSWGEFRMMSHLLIEELLEKYEKSHRVIHKDSLRAAVTKIDEGCKEFTKILERETAYHFVMSQDFEDLYSMCDDVRFRTDNLLRKELL